MDRQEKEEIHASHRKPKKRVFFSKTRIIVLAVVVALASLRVTIFWGYFLIVDGLLLGIPLAIAEPIHGAGSLSVSATGWLLMTAIYSGYAVLITLLFLYIASLRKSRKKVVLLITFFIGLVLTNILAFVWAMRDLLFYGIP